MEKHKRTFHVTGEMLRSMAVSSEILRVAKAAAKKSHQAAILAQRAYNKEHGTHHRIANSYQRD